MQVLSTRFLLLFSFLLIASPAFSQGNWLKVPSGTTADLVTVYFTSDETGWVAGDKGYLASTKDGGRSWRKYQLDTTENINEIYFRNEKNGYLVAGRKMFITKDAGSTWRETFIYRPGDFKIGQPEFLSIRFADKKRGLAVGSVLDRKGDVIDSVVMRTDDGGETWWRVLVPTKIELFHLDYNGSSHGWIVGDEGVILVTTDGGNTWTRQNSKTKVALYNIDFRDDELGYAVGEKGVILRTEDGGKNWELVTTNVTSTLMRVDFPDDRNGWIVGYDGSVMRSSDKGRTWVAEKSEQNANLYGLYISKKSGWAVGANGTILSYQ